MSPPIAVVGKSIQLPSASHSPNNLDYHGFWDLLIHKKDAYEDMPAARLEGISPDIPRPGGSFLKDATKFDNLEFGVSNKEALAMIAASRRLIEMSFLALLDAGIDSRTQRVGSFMSGTHVQYFEKDFLDDRGFSGTLHTMANRVSYTLDLTGPSFYLDAACSSSLTALHLAVRAIEAGDCNAALVGSVQYNTNLWDMITYYAGGIMSPDSKSKPFDISANGLAKGEGAIVLVLKPLEDALRDNDHVYSVVVGSAINNNGARASLYAPSPIGQQECIIESFRRAGRDPTEVDYVELHATGTAVGDPIDCNSAGELFKREDEVVIGSLKGNLGHLEMASFLASMIKACLIFEHKFIPANCNLVTRNPKILWDEYKLNAPDEAIPLPCRSPSGRSLISIACYGIGGSNGHVVLESAPQLADIDASIPEEAPILFLVGGLSPRATLEIADSLVKLLAIDSSSAALSTAVSHARRARQCTWRTYFTFTPGSTIAPKVENPVLVPKVATPLVYVFTGQGPQHVNMGRSLFKAHSVFRKTILDLDEVYQKVVGVSLLQTTGLFAGDNANLLPAFWRSDVTIPAMTMIQIALVDLLTSVGVKPNVLVGHSAGETALVYASGAGPKEMAFEIAIARARAMKLTESLGAGMAAFSCDTSCAISLIERVTHGESGVLDIACLNLPDAVVLSGSGYLIDKAVKLAQSEGVVARSIRTLNPSHSSLMDVCKEEYMRGMNDVFYRYAGPHKPSIKTYSSVGGQSILVEEFSPAYFWSNARNPVHFYETIDAIRRDTPDAAFVEISPHPALSSYVISRGVAAGSVLCPMRRPAKDASHSIEMAAFAEVLGRIATFGINTIDLTSLYGRASRNLSYDIPYPFTTRHFPMRFDGPRELEASAGGAISLRVKMNTKTHPELAEHTVNGEPICPAGVYIDMVLQTGAKQMWDLSFITILSLAPETPTEIRLEHDGSKWSFKSTLMGGLGSKLADEERTHLSGFLSNNAPAPRAPLDLNALRARLPVLKMDGFYDSIRALTDYGPTFQRLVSIRGFPEETLAEVALFPESTSNKYVFHPIVMDACFHLALFHPAVVASIDKNFVFLLKKMGKFTYYDAPKDDANVWSYATMRSWTPESRILDFTVVDVNGVILCTMQGLELQRLSVATKSIIENRYDLVYQPVINNITHPKLETITVSNDKEDIHTLLAALDSLAVSVISTSLKHEPAVSAEPSVQRYASFAKDAVLKNVGALPSHDVFENLRVKWPVYFELTDRIALAHKNLFKSSTAGQDVLFSDDIINRFNKSQPRYAAVVELVTCTFDKLITSIAKKGKYVLRVLEVGGGSGFLSGHLTDLLKTRDDLIVEYVVSDPFLTLADTAARATSYKWISGKVYDMAEEPEKQGFTPGMFDIITAFNALHVTDVPFTLSSLQRLLAPGGSLLVAELDGSPRNNGKPGNIWTDTIFGSLPGWFNSLLTADEWKSSLSNAGYIDIQTSTDPDNGLELVFIARSPSFTPAATLVRPKNAIFIPFKYGQEMAVQENLAKLDINENLSVWLLAEAGIDGDAGIGFTRCLIIEMSTWKVHLAIFESSSKETEKIDAILGYRKFIEEEDVVRFGRNGEPYLQKLALMPPPPPMAEFDPSGAWLLEGSEIVQTSLSPLTEFHVSVEVSSWSEAIGSFRGFSGAVIESKDSDFSAGQIVVGISVLPLSNKIISHGGLLALAPGNNEKVAGDALAILVGVLVLGPASTTRSGRSPPLRILATDTQVLGKKLAKLFSEMPSVARFELGHLEPSEEVFDIIVSDSATLIANPEIAPMAKRLFVWDTIIQEIVNTDPYSVGYALEAGLKLVSPSTESTVVCPRDLIYEKVGSLVLTKVPLFSADKAYVLIGGMSDVGIHVSTWMYKNGARHIVLTSRRGMKFMEENEFAATKQKFKYLKSLEDLDLRVEATDAASFEATAAMIKSIDRPIGGCLLMTMVLSDNLFMRHTEETFRSRVFDAKVKAVQTLNAAIPIEKLDFFVFFSSIVTILGNNGQTNYTSANTVVDGMLTKYENAFSLVPCGILGIGSWARLSTASWDYERLARWSITPDEVCESLGQGLAKLLRGDKFNLFIPDLDWKIIERDFGISTCARHLAPYQGIDGEDKKQDISELLGTVLSTIDVSIDDFSKDVPFTAYGLDSLGAVRLTEAIRPYTSVSQMQLLGGMTWKQLEEKMKVDDVES